MNLIGLAELAELYGVSKNTANTWARRHDWPAPVATLKMGPVWDRDQILRHKPLGFGRAGIDIQIPCWYCGSPLTSLTTGRVDQGRCDQDCGETTFQLELKDGQVRFSTGPLF